MKRKAKEIDADYFRRYSVTGTPYKQSWFEHTSIGEFIKAIRKYKLPYKRVAILGVASGQTLVRLYETLGIKAFGCEKFKGAFDKIPPFFSTQAQNKDMQVYLEEWQGPRFDSIFSNSLGYLENEDRIQSVLRAARNHADYFYFDPPKSDYPDEYRSISEGRRWWNNQFRKAEYSLVNKRSVWRTNGLDNKSKNITPKTI